ncbi:hypothetical protein WJX81_006160 [Elliptochloris bilobata]|uniref:Alpha/beta hydrolase fold-3 domain-containing protein n=1 Tax=Elliptochloris bilobata TaxID=381761 RepID=A0AAW1RAJ8_9CHLO
MPEPSCLVSVFQAQAEPAELPKERYIDNGLISIAELRYCARRRSIKGPRGPLPVWQIEERREVSSSGSFDVQIYRPSPPSTSQPALLYFHKGGYVSGDLDSHDAVCRVLAALTPCTVVAMDYRLAPEHPFPVAVMDAFLAAQWVAANAASLGIDLRCIAVGGDRASDNLAAAVSLLAQRMESPALAFQMLLYPLEWGDPELHASAAQVQTWCLQTNRDVERFVSGGPLPFGDRTSPLLAPDLPLALLVTAGCDPLRDGDWVHAGRLAAAGVLLPTEHKCYEGQLHRFASMAGVVENAGAALKEIVEALASKEEPLGPLPIETEDKQITSSTGTFGVRIYRTSSTWTSSPQPAVVYLHGGGFMVGDLDSHDGVCRALATLTPCTVVAVDYRLAPEHPFPAAVEDALAAVQWVAANAAALGIDPCRVAVAGDSAGGNLAAVVALLVKRAGGPKLAFQMLLYPVVGGSPELHPSHTDYREGFGLSEHDVKVFRTSYGSGPAGLPMGDHRISPLLAPDLAGLPPALVVTAECDVLRDEAADFARRLAEAGVPTGYKCFWGQIHGFFNLAGVTDRSKEAIKECAAALAEALRIPSDGKTN